ncbi:MAG: M20/M25/M40 family metallo-hydrolase [Nitritalea sp.]
MKSNFYFFLPSIFVLFLSFAAQAQSSSDKEFLLRDLEYLASDALKGRKTGSEGSKLAQAHIIEVFEQAGLRSQFPGYKQPFQFEARREQKVYEDATNLIGFLPGSRSEKLVVIMAHYDHLGEKDGVIFNGADDNASGVAALLGLVRYFSVNRPENSILFAVVDAEELGHHGSRALVADFPFPMKQVEVVINMDMLSRFDMARELWAVGTAHYPKLKQVLDTVQAGAEDVKLMYGHDTPGPGDWTMASDHAAFHREGVPFIYFGVDDHPDYHKPSDTFDRVDQEGFVQAFRLVLNSVKGLDQAITAGKTFR